MGSSVKNTFSIRLKRARKMAGLSLQELSNSLENKYTKQALSKYEKGLMNPSSQVLMSIAKVLNLKPDYFLKQRGTDFGVIQFRKKARLPKRDEESITEKVRDYVERYLELENILGLESNFINPIANIKVSNHKDLEDAALSLRISWGLGDGTIHSIVDVLELHNIKVYLSEEVDDFDGLAVLTSTGIPIVAVNAKDKSIERIRFTLVHELAHLLLSFDKNIENDHKTLEKYCHYFSSNFILPTDRLINPIGQQRNYIRIKELISIKESYGISLRASIHRLKELKVISETYYKKWMVFLNQKYGAKKEPGEYQGNESPKRFQQLINRALAEEVISLSKAATLLNVSINELRKSEGGAR